MANHTFSLGRYEHLNYMVINSLGRKPAGSLDIALKIKYKRITYHCICNIYWTTNYTLNYFSLFSGIIKQTVYRVDLKNMQY